MKTALAVLVLLFATIMMVVLWKAAPERPPEAKQIHEARGEIREIATNLSKAVIKHEAIAGYMPAMTMELTIRDTNELTGLAVGDLISFRLLTSDTTHWIDTLRKIGAVATNAITATPTPNEFVTPLNPELKKGDPVPDYELLAEDGRSIHLADFRGQAVALTFIFTRCPLPDFCPRMGMSFAKARSDLLARANAPTNWQFLSISFDPEFDTPEVLHNYAAAYRAGNADRWLFAVASRAVLANLAPRLDLLIAREAGGSISHNLRTVVLDPQGRIHQQFDGNAWTPEALAESVAAAAKTVRTGP